MLRMYVTQKGRPELFEQAKNFLAEHGSPSILGGILNVDGLATYIFLYRGSLPSPIQDREKLRIIDYDSGKSAADGYIMGHPSWDFNDALHAICIDQLLKMHTFRRMETSEFNSLCSQITRVYKRQNALFPNAKMKVPKRFRNSVSQMAGRFRNAVAETYGSVIGEPFSSNKLHQTGVYEARETREDYTPRNKEEKERDNQSNRKRKQVDHEIMFSVKKQTGEASIGPK